MKAAIKRKSILRNPVASIGQFTLSFLDVGGRIALFFADFVKALFRSPFYFQHFMRQCESVGINSLPLVMLTSFFTGGVLALQTYNGFGNAAIAANTLGSVVALSMLRELAPVLAALMVSGRIGAAMAAELGTMRVTEQIDALVTLATNPIQYLVVPRILACMFTLPLLVVLASIVGLYGGGIVAEHVLNMGNMSFWNSAFNAIDMDDIILCLVKAFAFGTIIGLMGCYHGYHSKGGAEGVGRSTTTAVVFASTAILVTDYFITSFFV